MPTLTRRQLLGSAILAGAGATVVQELGLFDPARAATNPDADPNFLTGRVVQFDSGTGVFQVVDLDLQVRTAQLTSASQVWCDNDNGACFVAFPLSPRQPGEQAVPGFAIEADTHAVTTVAPVSVRLTPSAWIAENMPPAWLQQGGPAH